MKQVGEFYRLARANWVENHGPRAKDHEMWAAVDMVCQPVWEYSDTGYVVLDLTPGHVAPGVGLAEGLGNGEGYALAWENDYGRAREWIPAHDDTVAMMGAGLDGWRVEHGVVEPCRVVFVADRDGVRSGFAEDFNEIRWVDAEPPLFITVFLAGMVTL